MEDRTQDVQSRPVLVSLCSWYKTPRSTLIASGMFGSYSSGWRTQNPHLGGLCSVDPSRCRQHHPGCCLYHQLRRPSHRLASESISNCLKISQDSIGHRWVTCSITNSQPSLSGYRDHLVQHFLWYRQNKLFQTPWPLSSATRIQSTCSRSLTSILILSLHFQMNP